MIEKPEQPAIPSGYVLHESGILVPEAIKHLEIPEDPLDIKVAVGERFAAAVHAPGRRPGAEWRAKKAETEHGEYTYDFRCKPWTKENSCGVKQDLLVSTLREVLLSNYTNDAHFYPYVLYDKNTGKIVPRMPRISKDALPYVESLGYELYASCLVIDIDTPHHKNWSHFSPEFFYEMLAPLLAHPALKDAAVFSSLAGFKVIIPLPHPIPIREYEARLRALYVDLQKAGINPDVHCCDWTHCYRCVLTCRPYDKSLPREENDKKAKLNKVLSRLITPLEDIRRADSLPEVSESEIQRISRRKDGTARSRGATIKSFASELPPNLVDAATAIGTVIRNGDQNGLHTAYLMTAVTMCSLGIVPELVPALIGEVCKVAGSKNQATNVEGAKRSVERWIQDEPVVGEKELRNGYPHIWIALKTHLSKLHRSVIEQPALSQKKLYTFEEAQAAMRKDFESFENGTFLVEVSPGGGKTHTAITHAVNQQRISDGEYKAAIVSNTNILAKQTHDNIVWLNGNSLRRFGPASVQGPGACAYPEQMDAIAASGQSPFATMCLGFGKKCPKFDTCTAKDRIEGDPEASIVTGAHASIPQILRDKGGDIDVFADELPSPVTTYRFSVRALNDTIRMGPEAFKKRFGQAIGPFRDAMIAWSNIVEDGASMNLRDAVDMAIDSIDYAHTRLACTLTGVQFENIVDAAIQAAALSTECDEDDEDEKKAHTTHRPPPIKKDIVDRIRNQASYAREVSRASKVYDILNRVARSKHRVIVTYLETNEGPHIQLVVVDETIRDLITRQNARTVIMDGHASSKIDLYRQLNPDLKVLSYPLQDAVPVRRLMMFSNTSRKALFDAKGEPFWDGMLGQIMSKMVALIVEKDSKKIVLCTFKSLRLIFQHAFGIKSPDVLDPVKAWIKLGKDPSRLEFHARRLRGLLHALPSDVQFNLYHYGVERGRNDSMDADTSITIGDPRPNIEHVKKVASLTDKDPSLLIEQIVGESLAQAHARLRHVSPYRKAVHKPLDQIHFGQIISVEPQWHMEDLTKHEILAYEQGKKRRLDAFQFRMLMAKNDLSQPETAKRLGVSLSTVKRWAQTDPLKGWATISEADYHLIINNIDDKDELLEELKRQSAAEFVSAQFDPALQELIAEQERLNAEDGTYDIGFQPYEETAPPTHPKPEMSDDEFWEMLRAAAAESPPVPHWQDDPDTPGDN